MVRWLVAVLVAALVVLGATGHGAAADVEGVAGERAAQGITVVDADTSVTTSVPERIPATTLEAEARDDGTQPAPWLIGSALAAGAVILLGGSLLKRRAR